METDGKGILLLAEQGVALPPGHAPQISESLQRSGPLLVDLAVAKSRRPGKRVGGKKHILRAGIGDSCIIDSLLNADVYWLRRARAAALSCNVTGAWGTQFASI